MQERKLKAGLRGKTALITGASRGIGLAIADALAAEGCNLILTARNTKSLKKISRELASLKIRVLAHPCDVRDPHSIDALFRAIRASFASSISSSTTPASRTPISPSRNFLTLFGKTSSRPTSTEHFS